MVLNRNPRQFLQRNRTGGVLRRAHRAWHRLFERPAVAGRLHSYQDTQISRLGGANFHEIPINAPVAQAHNNQRDGVHRQAINRGRVAYEPNSLGGGCPFQAGAAVSRHFASPSPATRCAATPNDLPSTTHKPRSFTTAKRRSRKAHIRRAFRFELTKVQVPAIRQRVVAMLANVDAGLAKNLADDLGMGNAKPLPRALEDDARNPK